MNQKQLILLGENKLKQFKIEEPYLKAKKLLEFILGQNAEQFIVHSLDEVTFETQLEFETNLQDIINGKPLQYITHSQEFMGLNFYVDENVLIPQPDTEILVETTLKIIEDQEKTKKEVLEENQNKEKWNDKKENMIKILDLCTGSGCIGISLAKYIENVQVTASDISSKALEIAQKNAISSQVVDKMKFACSNLLEQIEKSQFDYIVSNPPYIETSTILELPKEVQQEPYIALNGGEDGLDFYKAILKQAPNYLKIDGYLLLEIGFNQGEKIINLWRNLKNSSLTLVTTKPIQDLGKNDRVLVFKNMKTNVEVRKQ